jgi:hypothetical protein
MATPSVASRPFGATSIAYDCSDAAMVPELIDGFTADCAEASSEVSDPFSYGVALWTLGTVGIWLVGVGMLGAAWAGLWRGRR